MPTEPSLIFRCTEEFRRAVRFKALDKGLSVQRVMEEVLTAWLRDELVPPSHLGAAPAKPATKLQGMISEIEASGREDLVQILLTVAETVAQQLKKEE